MNTDRATGNWRVVKSKIREQWGELTDSDIDQLQGHGEQLAGKLQETYGMTRGEAERQAGYFRAQYNWN